MSNPTIRVRLIAGDDELNIHDWKDYVLMGNGLIDNGSSVELRWQVPLEPCEGGTGNLQRLVGELRKYIQRAKLYEQENIGNPVYLAVYWPECEDIHIPSWGRGWRYKRIVDGVLAEATPGMGQGQPDMRFGSDAIPVLAAMFAVKQDPDGEYAWRSDLRWVCQAKGHIEPVAENGIKLWEESQNIITNGDFELGKAGWTDTGLTSAVNTEHVNFGTQALLVTPAVGKTETTFTDPSPASHFIATAWFYLPCGVDEEKVFLCLQDDKLAEVCTECADIHDEWQRVRVDYDTDPTSANWYVRIKCTDANASRYFWVDGVQVEMRLAADGPTPFIEPERHLGEVWDTCGSPHASTSTRNEGECRIVRPIEKGYATPCCGTFHCWYRPGYDNTDISGTGQATIFDWMGVDSSNFIWVYFDYSTNTFELKTNGAVQVQTVDAFSEGDYIGVGASWDFINDEYKLYLRGIPGTTGTTAKVCPDLRTYDIFWGSEFDHDNQANGDIFDARIWTEILTDEQMKAIYKAGRGNGELPYIWSEKGAAFLTLDDGTSMSWGVELENHDDCGVGDTNLIEIGNVPGDAESPGKLIVTTEETPEGDYNGLMWWGLRKPKADVITIERRGQWIYEAEDSAYNAVTWTLKNDDAANTSNGEYLQTNPIDTTFANAYGIDWIICRDHEINCLSGQWRLFIRMRTNAPADVHVRAGVWDKFHRVIEYIPNEDGIQLDYTSAMGSGGIWELRPMGVINIPPYRMMESSLLGEGAPYETVSPQFFIQPKGAAGTELLDIDYVMLMPEENCGRWGVPDSLSYPDHAFWPEEHVFGLVDSYSRPPYSGMSVYKAGDSIYSGITSYQPLGYIGDSPTFPAPGPSRAQFAVTVIDHPTLTGWYRHAIDTALYVDLLLSARYYRSR